MVADEGIAQRAPVPLLPQLPDRGEVPRALRHLRARYPQQPGVHPVAGQRRAAGDLLHLRDLRLMVGEDQVDGPAVQVILRAEELLRDRRVLDVPAGTARPERGVPAGLTWLSPLPQREVAGVA